MSHYNKLKSKYRNQTKKYLKELRAEQENFLLMYKTLTNLVSKITKLKDFTQYVTDQKILWENGKGMRMINDYIFGNYGDLES